MLGRMGAKWDVAKNYFVEHVPWGWDFGKPAKADGTLPVNLYGWRPRSLEFLSQHGADPSKINVIWDTWGRVIGKKI
jgi:hypothetical protein